MDDKNIVIGCLNLIDLGSQRGAWQGPELANVGALRNALVEIAKTFPEIKNEEKVETNETENKKSLGSDKK
jgi:hypothetical protein|tara:strand:- start:7250 stop:7462 length:213 start_codon:yes stop_codon:yes gene_type:complete